MADWQANLDQTRAALVEFEAEYADAVVKLAGAAAHVREGILERAQGRIDEAKQMIETFEYQIRIEGGEPS